MKNAIVKERYFPKGTSESTKQDYYDKQARLLYENLYGLPGARKVHNDIDLYNIPSKKKAGK